MGTFKYRESIDSPWKELPVIGDIFTQDVRPVAPSGGGGISTDTHELITINRATNGSGYDWIDWTDYITDFSKVEVLVIFKGQTPYIYTAGIMPGLDENGRLICYCAKYSSSGNTIALGSSSSYLEFSASGVKVYDGAYLSSSKNAIFLVLRKEAA